MPDPRVSGAHHVTDAGVEDEAWPSRDSTFRPGDAGAPSAPSSGRWHPHTDGFAIASLVCSIVGFVTGLGAVLGIVFGFVARRRIRRSENLTGQGLALSGIIIGLLALIAFLVATAVLLASESTPVPSAARSFIVTTGPPADASLARHELILRTAYPAGGTGGGRGSQNTQASFFGGLDAATASQLATCLGVGPADIDRSPAEAADQNYTSADATWQISDTVDVFPTTAGARADLEAAASPNVGPCVLRFVDSPQGPGLLQGPELQKAVAQAFGARAKAGTTTITQRRLIADDGSHDIDVESSFPIVGGGTNTVFHSDQVLVQRGRSESNILIMEVASHPPAIALVNRLAQAAAKQMASR